LLLFLVSLLGMTSPKVMQATAGQDVPQPIGPFSQAVHAGQFLFISGQLPIDPQTGRLVEDTIEAQVRRSIDNIEALLHAEGLTLAHVVRTEVYLKDMNDFARMNTVYAERFTGATKPARQAMQVVMLPLDARVEISCIAFIAP
jgi:2-iminobutanoate/2-iminopropanoate deaminase